MKKTALMMFCLVMSSFFAIGGVLAENLPPAAGMLTGSKNSSSVGEEISFTTTFIDPDGWDHPEHGIYWVLTAFMSKTDKTRRLYCLYRKYNNRLYLYDYSVGRYVGGGRPGSTLIIKTDYAKLDCFRTFVSGHDDTMTITWAITFKEALAGETYNVRQYVTDITRKKTWAKTGEWTVFECIPRLIRFQGKLGDDAGESLTGEFTITFRLYDADTGNFPLWEEVQFGVDIENGVLDVELGSVMPIDLPFDKQYWLGVEVESDGEMVPRFKLTTVPYAIRSE